MSWQTSAIHDGAKLQTLYAAHAFHELRHRKLLQFVHLVRLETKLRHISRRACSGPIRRVSPHSCAAHGNGAVEQTFGRRHSHQRADFSPTAGLTEDRNVPRIAAEVRYVVPHPFQRRNAVEHANVTRPGILLAT